MSPSIQQALKELAEAAGQPIEWSDRWSEEDMADATKEALRNFEATEESEWGT